MVKNFRVGKII